MENRKIGSLTATVVGIGCNNFGSRIDDKRTEEVIDAALEAGINFFDAADLEEIDTLLRGGAGTAIKA